MNISVEHIDEFEDSYVVWIELSGVSPKLVWEARMIDQENFIEDGFGCCVVFDKETNHLEFIEDAPGREVFYVDNNGDKHWFNYQLNHEDGSECFVVAMQGILQLTKSNGILM